MTWTIEQKIAVALRLPWTVVAEQTPEGDRLLRVVELPAAVGSGQTDQELERDFWESLAATLAAYFEFNDPLPRPATWNGPLPWDLPIYSFSAPGAPPVAAVEFASEPPLQTVRIAA